MNLFTFVNSDIVDKINASVELIIIIPSIIEVIHIIRVKTSISINFNNMFYWLGYCFWTAIYFYVLNQWFSSLTSVFWIFWYILKMLVVLKYKPDQYTPAEQ
jgi:hypothetical protein